MPVVSVASEPVHYRRSGGTGPPLLLVHGSGGSLRHWPESLRGSRDVDAVCVDLPGHGRSGGAGRSRVKDYADWLSAFAGALGITDAAVAGHSLGGAVALCLALRRPPWLSRLVLVGTGARLRVRPEMLALVGADFPAAVRTMANWAFGPEPRTALVDEFCRGLTENGPEILFGDLSACDRFDVMDRVDRIRLPTLVVAADHDRLTPVKYGACLRDKIPGAEMAVIQGAGHMMALEQETAFAARLLPFLDR